MQQPISPYTWIGRLPNGRALVAVLLVMSALPLILTNKSMAIQIIIWGILGLSYNLLLGYTGLLSFSHSSFFGIGSYAAALFMKHVTSSLTAAFVVGAVASVAAAVLIGWLSLRRRGVTSTMLTLAFCQMIYFLAFQVFDEYTGGDDGLSGVPTPPIKIPGVGSIPLISVRYPINFYYFSFVVFALSLVAMWRIVHSPFGYSLIAVRESEERARALGYDTTKIQIAAFALAGGFAGVAGVLNALYLAYVPIVSLHLQTSGSVLMMTILGGRESFFGPLFGAGLYWAVAETLSRVTEYWPLVVGGVFMLTVLFFPNGLAGAVFWIWQLGQKASSRSVVLGEPKREVRAARE